MKKVISVLSALLLTLGMGVALASPASAIGKCSGSLVEVRHQNGSSITPTVQVLRNGTWYTVAGIGTFCGTHVRYTSWAGNCSGTGLKWYTSQYKTASKTMNRNTSYALPTNIWSGLPYVEFWSWCR